MAGDIVSVRNVNAVLGFLFVVISALVCTIVAVSSGDTALSETRASETGAQRDLSATCDATIADSFRTAESNVLRNVESILAALMAQVEVQVNNFLMIPQGMAEARVNKLRAVHPRHTLDWEYVKTLRHELYHDTMMPGVTASGFFNAKMQMLLYLEDDDTIGETQYAPYHRMVVTWNSGLAVNADRELTTMEKKRCINDPRVKGLPNGTTTCSYWADVTPGVEGSVVPDGSWMDVENYPTSCDTGDCPGVYGFGSSCECNLNNPVNPFNVDENTCGVSDTAAEHFNRASPEIHTRGLNPEKWKTGACALGMVPSSQDFLLLGEMLVGPNEMRWTPVVEMEMYIAIILIGTFAHPAMSEAPYSSTVIGSAIPGKGAGPGVKGGLFLYGADVRDVSLFLSKISVEDTRARLWITVASDWLWDAIPGILADSTNMLVGVSHGNATTILRTKSGMFGEAYSMKPKLMKDTDADDPIIHSTTNWIAQQEEGEEKAYLAIRKRQELSGGRPLKYDVTHTASGAEVTEPFYLSVRKVENDHGINWWLAVTIDHEAMLGEIDRERLASEQEIAAKQRQTAERIARERKRVDDKLAEDQAVLFYGILPAIIIVLVAINIVFAIAITAPLRKLSRQMNSVATMQLDGIDDAMPKSSLAEVRGMQRSFLRMVRNMRELRNYMPQSLIADAGAEEEEEDIDIPEASTKAGTVRSKASAASSRTASRVAASGAASAASASRGVASTAASSQSAAMKAYLKKVAGQGVKKKRCSLLVSNVADWHKHCEAEGDKRIEALHQDVVALFLSTTNESKGVVDSFSGDRVVASYNAVKNLATHRVQVATGASSFGEQVANITAKKPLRASMAAGTGDALCGNVGCPGLKKFTMFGSFVSLCYALERYSRTVGSERAVCDSAVAEDAGNSFYLRSIGTVVFAKKPNKNQNQHKVSEVMEKKKVSEDEWMYQLEEGAASDPYSDWNECIAHALAGAWDEVRGLREKSEQLRKLLAADPAGQHLTAQLDESQPPLTTIVFH